MERDHGPSAEGAASFHTTEQRALAGVDRLKGKFRSFLLASFQNHLSDQLDRARRLKRRGDKEFVRLEAEEAEERYRLEPVGEAGDKRRRFSSSRRQESRKRPASR